jgi:hypothetical protein
MALKVLQTLKLNKKQMKNIVTPERIDRIENGDIVG